MKAVIQRVKLASVKINSKVEMLSALKAGASVQKIDKGLVILLGISETDSEKEIEWMIGKIINMRIFGDEKGKMNLSVKDINGEILVVSQFTLLADCKKGNRPSFTEAARPEKAEKLYNLFVEKLKETGIKVETGIFGSMMDVNLVNNGPVTIILESRT